MTTLNELLFTIRDERGGFLTIDDIRELTKLDRLRNVLVRCGNGRFTCPAQDVMHFLAIIAREQTDYVRDVSLLATDPIYTRSQDLAAQNLERHGRYGTEDYGGAFDGFSVSSDADPGL